MVAIKRNALASWPGLTSDLVNKYLPRTEETIKGHILQHYKGSQINQIETRGPQSGSARTPRDPNEENKSTLIQDH